MSESKNGLRMGGGARDLQPEGVSHTHTNMQTDANMWIHCRGLEVFWMRHINTSELFLTEMGTQAHAHKGMCRLKDIKISMLSSFIYFLNPLNAVLPCVSS